MFAKPGCCGEAVFLLGNLVILVISWNLLIFQIFLRIDLITCVFCPFSEQVPELKRFRNIIHFFTLILGRTTLIIFTPQLKIYRYVMIWCKSISHNKIISHYFAPPRTLPSITKKPHPWQNCTNWIWNLLKISYQKQYKHVIYT